MALILLVGTIVHAATPGSPVVADAVFIAAPEPMEQINTEEISDLEFSVSDKPTSIQLLAISDEVLEEVEAEEVFPGEVFTVPFFSQFADITPVEWRKVSCGIAGVSMLIDFYQPGSAVPDLLLQQGRAAGAFLSDAGWTHQGLINLTKQFGLNGYSRDMAGLSMSSAFSELKEVLKDGPVMVSVHYTFQPTNPIPHLVVVNGVADGKVFYNDPAEASGGGSISIEQFQSAWKKRYIEIRPVG